MSSCWRRLSNLRKSHVVGVGELGIRCQHLHIAAARVNNKNNCKQKFQYIRISSPWSALLCRSSWLCMYRRVVVNMCLFTGTRLVGNVNL